MITKVSKTFITIYPLFKKKKNNKINFFQSLQSNWTTYTVIDIQEVRRDMVIVRICKWRSLLL